uniref:Tissue factor pathway inhibitor n=1 Tax=Heligmosomoides polygyrus TaxID=6339 RepID=A0A183GJ10_HELPZ
LSLHEELPSCPYHCLHRFPRLVSASKNVCQQKMESGPCLALIKRYGYSVSLNKCVEFTYGGCMGNDNNFKTLQECEKKCLASKVYGKPVVQPVELPVADAAAVASGDICQMKLETGPCRGYIKRFGYDAKKGKCVKFIYGGCGGNENNFESRNQCKRRCKVQRSRSQK